MVQQRRTNGSDFDPDELVQASDQHARSIEELRAEVQNIQSWIWPLQSNDNFANHFTNVTTSSKTMDAALTELVKELIIHDKDVQEVLKREVSNIDRNWATSFVKKIGFGVWTLIVALISGGAVLLLAS